MSVKVVDSSVLGAIAFGEPELAEAEELVGDARLAAPALLRYEVANIAWKKTRKHPAKAEEIAAGLHFALELDVEYHDVDHDAVLAIAVEKDVTAYDASYLWLARSLRAPLLTFDKKLRAAG
jgi:predicted nucleic acid-binding protein